MPQKVLGAPSRLYRKPSPLDDDLGWMDFPGVGHVLELGSTSDGGIKART